MKILGGNGLDGVVEGELYDKRLRLGAGCRCEEQHQQGGPEAQEAAHGWAWGVAAGAWDLA